MKNKKVYLAVDLGAGSSRVLAALYDGSKIELREMHRFPSEALECPDGSHWNFSGLWEEIKKGLALAFAEYGDAVVSIGVDTWGVDYGLVDPSGRLLNEPFQYRDKRTNGVMDEAFLLLSKKEIYERTGIQFLFFNTLYQLLAEKRRTGSFPEEATLLFIPDLVNYYLTGRKANERSIASTGQLLDARTRQWDSGLLSRMGIPETLFAGLADAGSDLGSLKPELVSLLGGKARVIAVGSHDTASAVAGIPSLEENPVFLSSGTWSLMGSELDSPVLTEEGFEFGFSNEGGVYGTTRLLKNIAGMWLLQECKKQWDKQGTIYPYDELVKMAEVEPPSSSFMDPDAVDFQAPADMTLAIAEYCRKKGRNVPQTPGQFTRLILESLAKKYSIVKEQLEKLTGRPVKKIYIVGGGSQNMLLNQLAANATGCEIVAGPVEATSLGNVLVQMIASGEIKSLQEGRHILAKSFEPRIFLPK